MTRKNKEYINRIELSPRKWSVDKGNILTILGLDTREKWVNFLYSVMTFVALVVVYFIYGAGLIDNFLAFIIGMIIVGVRIGVRVYEKLTDEKFSESTLEKRIFFIITNIVFLYGVMMMLNLVFSFEFWYRIGISNRWIDDILISVNSLLILIIAMGVYLFWDRRSAMKYPVKEQARKRAVDLELGNLIVIVWFLIIIPVVLIFTIIPIATTIDLQIWGGTGMSYVYDQEYSGILNGVFSGQGIDDWFAYVFFILFQAPIPSLMIGFMGISSIAVILAQSLAGTGRVVVGVASGIIAIIPMLFVLSAISGSIPPPQELIDQIGLNYSIASFIHGLGLVITFTVMISLMGVFIVSSRALTADFSRTR